MWDAGSALCHVYCTCLTGVHSPVSGVKDSVPKVIGPKLGTIMNGFCAPNMSHPDVCCPALYLLLDSRNFPFSRLEPELSTGVVSVQFALTSSTFSVAITAATL